MKRRKYGLLTELQYKVLKLRLQGLTQSEVAKILGTTRENVSILEKRAWENIELAKITLNIYKELTAKAKIIIPPNTHLVDIPRIVIGEADKVKVKLKANFTRIYDEIRFKARECIKGTHVIKPIMILILSDGDIEVIPKD
ncbi:MAG TPA: Tfx family DNA-binding protein [Desulfurococcales archaeon]|nr:Tfx family DNA-binding protein [Desulfurococcales archaeon]